MASVFDYDRSEVSRVYAKARALTDESEALWLDEVARAAPGGTRRVLDLGCGTGRFTAPLAARLRARVVGVDPSLKMLAEAHAAASVAWIAGAAEALPLRGPFDLVFASMVYHHLTDPRRALAEVRRVLRPGGRLVIRTPTLEDVAGYRFLECFPGAKEIDRRRMPPERAVLAAAAGAGLTRVECRTVQQLYASDPRECYARLAKRGLSSLQMISDADFEAGLAALRDWIERIGSGPVREPLHLFVFERQAAGSRR